LTSHTGARTIFLRTWRNHLDGSIHGIVVNISVIGSGMVKTRGEQYPIGWIIMFVDPTFGNDMFASPLDLRTRLVGDDGCPITPQDLFGSRKHDHKERYDFHSCSFKKIITLYHLEKYRNPRVPLCIGRFWMHN
jgi:hypothetical protein